MLNVCLRTFTPTLNGDADRRSDALRAPSLKGALAFWARARWLTRESREATEAKQQVLFGKAAGKSGHAAQFRLIMPHPPEARGRVREIECNFPYALRQLEMHPYISEGTAVSLHIPLQGDRSGAEAVQELAHAFWLTSHFGGWGAKTRRGMGGFVLEGVPLEFGCSWEWRFRTPEQAITELSAGLEAAVGNVEAGQDRSWDDLAGLGRGVWRVSILQTRFRTWGESLRAALDAAMATGAFDADLVISLRAVPVRDEFLPMIHSFVLQNTDKAPLVQLHRALDDAGWRRIWGH